MKWTRAEDKLLREAYVQGCTAKGALQFVPHRSVYGIQMRMYRLGMTMRGNGMVRKRNVGLPLTDHMYTSLRLLANSRGLTMSRYCRKIIESHVSINSCGKRVEKTAESA